MALNSALARVSTPYAYYLTQHVLCELSLLHFKYTLFKLLDFTRTFALARTSLIEMTSFEAFTSALARISTTSTYFAN